MWYTVLKKLANITSVNIFLPYELRNVGYWYVSATLFSSNFEPVFVWVCGFTEAGMSLQGKQANLRPCLAMKLLMTKVTLERISLVLVSVQLSISLPKAMYWIASSQNLWLFLDEEAVQVKLSNCYKSQIVITVNISSNYMVFCYCWFFMPHFIEMLLRNWPTSIISFHKNTR